MKKFFYLFLFSATLYSCGRISNEDLAEHNWKYTGGHYYGDLIWFNKKNAADTTYKFWLSDDTLFNDGTPVALIIEAKEKLDGRWRISLQDFQSGEESVYHDI